MTSYGRELNEDYRIRYSRCVLDLDSMNKEMSLYLEAIQQYCLDVRNRTSVALLWALLSVHILTFCVTSTRNRLHQIMEQIR